MLRKTFRKLIKRKQIESSLDPFPFFQIFDLKVDGSSTKVEFKASTQFQSISRLMWFADTGTSFEWTNLADIAAIDPGIQFVYAGKKLLPKPITSNADIAKYSFNAEDKADKKAAPGFVFVGRMSWFLILGRTEGLVINEYREFKVVVEADISGVTELELVLEGRRF